MNGNLGSASSEDTTLREIAPVRAINHSHRTAAGQDDPQTQQPGYVNLAGWPRLVNARPFFSRPIRAGMAPGAEAPAEAPKANCMGP